MWLELALGLLAVLLLLPLVPVELALEAEGDALRGSGRARARIEWLFGLVRFTLRRGEPRERAPRERRAFDAWAALTSEGFLDHAGRFVRRLLRWTRVRELALRLRLGTGDPADTGRAIGMLSPVWAIANAARPGAVEIAAEWRDQALDGLARARVRAHPYPILGATIAFFASPTAWRAIRAGRGRA